MITLTDEEFLNILSKADVFKNADARLDKALSALCSVIAPTQYAIFSEETQLLGYLAGLGMISKELEEDVSYYIYEAMGIDNPCWCTYNKKKYNAQDPEQYLEFIRATRNYIA